MGLSERLRALEQQAAQRGDGAEALVARVVGALFWGNNPADAYDNIAPPNVNEKLRLDLHAWLADHPGATLHDLTCCPAAQEAAAHVKLDVGMCPNWYASDEDHAAAMAEWQALGSPNQPLPEFTTRKDNA